MKLKCRDKKKSQIIKTNAFMPKKKRKREANTKLRK